MKQLVVTADDFGMSLEVNEAVEAAHRDGILTGASLVVAGDAAEDAIRRARRLPTLAVGLHLALFGARAAAPGRSPLAPDGVNLGESPVRTGIAMMLSARARAALRREIAAQADAFRRTGLGCTHLDGHWHCHQHPAVLPLALAAAASLGARAVRVPHETGAFSRAAAGQGGVARPAQSLAHAPLAALMRRAARARGFATNDHFFGKVDAGAITLPLLLGMVAALPAGVTELGLHPARPGWSGSGPHAPPPHWRQDEELAALTSPDLRAALARHDVRLARWDEIA
ncbi:MAG: hopanoid biosynthesis-associated protein HpnK [Sphingomonadales bacterium]|nr:hopanoid biosynthesis-associated protein HpnK [Sphingomonadales bacterium]